VGRIGATRGLKIDPADFGMDEERELDGYLENVLKPKKGGASRMGTTEQRRKTNF